MAESRTEEGGEEQGGQIKSARGQARAWSAPPPKAPAAYYTGDANAGVAEFEQRLEGRGGRSEVKRKKGRGKNLLPGAHRWGLQATTPATVIGWNVDQT